MRKYRLAFNLKSFSVKKERYPLLYIVLYVMKISEILLRFFIETPTVYIKTYKYIFSLHSYINN